MNRSFEHDVTDRLGRLETKLDFLLREIHGDNRPGMLGELEKLTRRVQYLEEHHKNDHHTLRQTAALAAFLINAALAVGAWFR